MLGSKLKILGLCTLALAVMAIGAGSAQAEPNAFWLVNGVKISKELLPSLSGVLENNIGRLLAKIGANAFHISCTGVELIEAHLVEPNGANLGMVRFTGCKLFKLVGETATELKACEPHEGAEKGVILTVNVKSLILLHEPKAGVKEGVIDFEPKEGEGKNFATVNTSEECSFGEKIVIGGTTAGPAGKVVLKDCEGKFLTDLVTHLFEQNSLTKLYVNGNESNVATLDGSILISLSGAHKGLTWAGHPDGPA